jgi:hypothetical protein
VSVLSESINFGLLCYCVNWTMSQYLVTGQQFCSIYRLTADVIHFKLLPCSKCHILCSGWFTRVRFLSLNSTQSRVVTGLLTGHNTLCRHLHLMGLTASPLFRKCGAEEKISAHILCRCEALALIRHAYLSSSFLKPENINSQNLGAIWRFSKAAGLPWGMIGAQRACLF